MPELADDYIPLFPHWQVAGGAVTGACFNFSTGGAFDWRPAQGAGARAAPIDICKIQ
jgi:hypothetical protein